MSKDHRRIRIFNKHVTNRILGRFAGTSRGPFATIRHVGRRSGKPYETTIMVRSSGENFVIVLTYGPNVDWYRNIQAAGRCTILWHGKEHTLGKPELIDAQAALSVFSPFQRRVLQILGAKDFVLMKPIAPEPAELDLVQGR